MAVNKTKLTTGGEVGEAAVKRPLHYEIILKFKLLSVSKKISLFIVSSLIFLGVLTMIYMLNESAKTSIIPVNNQQADQSLVNEALDSLQKDPSSIPSGVFHPEIEDSFDSNNGADSTEANQQ